ncbi:hypothetical protein OFQ66_03450 [Brachyspira hyodysenteriae]|nr:hypothetical protein [Brachyspira hyodysenteriae]
MGNYINNIDYKKVVALKDLVAIKDISMLPLVDRKSLAMTIISADKSKEIPHIQAQEMFWLQ